MARKKKVKAAEVAPEVTETVEVVVEKAPAPKAKALEEMTKEELIEVAREKGIRLDRGMTQKEILKKVSKNA